MTGEELAAVLDAWEERFVQREPDVRAFVDEPERFERVRAAAAGAGGPLSGLLLGVKDIFHVEGLPTRAGSELPVSELSGEEGPAVSALRAAGALVAGKTVTTEFAYFEPGPTRNPAHLEHTPGGSSSGSAAAVAAGLCDLALGTQTIGSISRPAAYCGIAGWKPSYERVSRAGVIPLSPSLDHVGLLARDVATLKRGAAIVAAADWSAPAPRATKPRLAVPAGPYLGAATDEGRERFAAARVRLLEAGYEIVDLPAMADFPAIVERHRRLVAYDCARVHADWFERYGELYRERTAELIERGRRVSDAEAESDRAGRTALRQAFEAAMNEHGIDLWLSPAAPGPAPRGLASTGDPVMNLPWTHAGLPTLALPAGRTAAGLPTGVQLAARFGRDEELLAWGEELEAALATAGAKGER